MSGSNSHQSASNFIYHTLYVILRWAKSVVSALIHAEVLTSEAERGPALRLSSSQRNDDFLVASGKDDAAILDRFYCDLVRLTP